VGRGRRTERCTHLSGGADKAAFVRANADVLAFAGTVRGARLASQLAVPQRDGNGCPEGSGQPTSYRTDRVYRLPPGTTASDVFAYYERVLLRRDPEPPNGGLYPPADVAAGNPARERARSRAAATNSRKSGAGRVGRDLNSGWNWLATNHG
jgi:hypothetical protein